MFCAITRRLSSFSSNIRWKEIAIPVPWGHIVGKSWGDEKSSRKVLCLHGTGIAAVYGSVMPEHVQRMVLIEGLAPVEMEETARLKPEDVEKMELTDGSAPFSKKEEEIPSMICKYLTGLPDREATSNRVYKSEEKIIQRIMMKNGELTEQSARVLAVRGTKKNKNGSFEFVRDLALASRPLSSLTSGAVAKLISNIAQPTLVILANNSYWKHHVRKMLSSYTNPMISIQHVEGNHHVHLNQPELVAEHVSAFLDLVQC